MWSRYFDRFARRLVRARLAGRHEILGCTIEEVEQIQQAQHVELPPIYKEFLFRMGRGAGRLAQGTSYYYPELLDLKKFAFNLLSQSGSKYSLADNAFVFSMHQGYQFEFFHAGIDDPAVYIYDERMDVPEQSFDHYSKYLDAWLLWHARLR
jgi:hypothetical protein